MWSGFVVGDGFKEDFLNLSCNNMYTLANTHIYRDFFFFNLEFVSVWGIDKGVSSLPCALMIRELKLWNLMSWG